MALEFLTQGGPPVGTVNQAQQSTLPDWYNSYIQGIAGKATDIASNPYQVYPGQRIADFNDDQMHAFQAARTNQGAYKPELDAAGSTLSGVMPAVQGALGQAATYGANATGAVAGPAQSWTDPGTAAKYMSPYTSSVVNEIGRLGNQNLFENVIPQVQSNFVGAGQFGSARNADILGHAVRDTQAGITGQQSTALQAGYTGAEQAFNTDANRAQQQQGLQATTNLGAGNLATSGATAGANAGLATGANLGALGQLKQTLGANDVNNLNQVGTQQQGLEQTGYNTAYQDFLNQQNWDWSQLGKVQGAVQGVQLPTGTSAATNTSQTTAGASPLQWLTALQGIYNSVPNTTAPAPGP